MNTVKKKDVVLVETKAIETSDSDKRVGKRVASGKSLSRKCVGMLAKRKERTLEGSLDTDGMYIDILINSIIFTRALCDSGCQCFATMSEQFVKERGLDMSSIQPRPLKQVTTTKNRPMIRQIAIFIADIDGMEEKIVAYVILEQIDNIILGKGWME